MSDESSIPDCDYWTAVFGPGEGRMAWRSAPLSSDGIPYWHAAARILSIDGAITEASLALKDPEGEPRRLGVLEKGLTDGSLTDADFVLDAVRDLVECHDDSRGSAAAKSYLAGWICADVVGRCLK